MHGLSARAVIRGKRATKNIRKCAFPEVLFDLLVCTNRSFLVFSGVLFGLLPSTNRSFVVFPEVFFGLLPVVFPYIKALGVRNFLLFCSIEQREVLHEEGTIY